MLKWWGASLNDGELEENLSHGSLSSRDRQAFLVEKDQEKWSKAEPVFCRGLYYSPTMVTLQFRVMTRNPSKSDWSMLPGGHRLKVTGAVRSLCSPRRWEIFARICVSLLQNTSRWELEVLKGQFQAQKHEVVLLSPVEAALSCLRQSLPDNCSDQRPAAAVAHLAILTLLGHSRPLAVLTCLHQESGCLRMQEK